MRQHTPGPWRIGDGGCTIFGPKDPTRAAPKVIASITKAPFPSDEQYANANLIAAAPGMLETLRNLEKVGMSIRAESVIWQDIRNALAKAEGENP